MNAHSRVLVVEDDQVLQDALCDTLTFGGHEAIPAANGVEALAQANSKSVDLIISDVQMDQMDGYQLLRAIKKSSPDIPVVMITAHGGVEGAVEAMRSGASDYLQKPFQAEVLLDMVERFCSGQKQQTDQSNIVAVHEKTERLFRIAKRVANSDATVLLSGESGCGKEVVAQYIHAKSPRRNAAFIAVNCAAIPENMLESMLFGYEKGAYTGAHQSRVGKFEQANGGTILLDEISEMDLALQAKLLRVLQEREVERLGGNKLIPLDVRVLATTNRNLREEVNEGNFREDLFYRLSVFPMTLPPLRERKSDIVPLANRILGKSSDCPGLSLSKCAMKKLEHYDWPGNVRELENCIQRAIILCDGREIEAVDVEFEIDAEVSEDSIAREGLLDGNLKAMESQTILDALSSVNGSRKIAAEKLGISPRTLRYKLARLKEQGLAIPVAAR